MKNMLCNICIVCMLDAINIQNSQYLFKQASNTLFPFYAAVCDEQCSLHGGVCDNGKCEFRCSDYAGYTCQKGSTILPSLSMCHDVLVRDADGQHCAPSELSILQQLEAVVLVPNYNRLMPSGRTFLNFFNTANCAAAAKRLACWVRFPLNHSSIFHGMNFF
jgi:hypothetical protein